MLIEQGTHFHNYAIHTLSIIGQLIFAVQWNTKKEPVKWKQDFKSKAWSVQKGALPSNALAKAKSQFAKKYENLVRARNKVLRLYQTVSKISHPRPLRPSYIQPVWRRHSPGPHFSLEA